MTKSKLSVASLLVLALTTSFIVPAVAKEALRRGASPARTTRARANAANPCGSMAVLGRSHATGVRFDANGSPRISTFYPVGYQSEVALQHAFIPPFTDECRR